jgi:hypothetical protein
VGLEQKTLAFLALTSSSSSDEVWILDVSDPTKIKKISGINVSGSEDANTLFLSGDKLFMGRDYGSMNPEVFAVDITDIYNPKMIASLDLVLKPVSSYVSSMCTIANKIFIATTDKDTQLQIYDFSGNTFSLVKAISLGAPVTRLDCVGDMVVSALKGADSFAIITP